jgi:squalene synthase HpnC
VIRRVLAPSVIRPDPPVATPGAPLEPAACFAYCEAIVRAHHENFPVGSFFLPQTLRPHMAALYAFARFADDFADEPAYAGRRAQELDRWEDLLLACFHGEADHPIFVALGETVRRFELPMAPFADILQAFRMDLRTRRYATFADLMAYVERAALPIGRLILYVFGVRDAERMRFGDELATALALTSFWQDTRRDLERDRVYVPQEDLRHFNLTEDDLAAGRQTPALTALVRYETARTRAIFERARPLLDLAPRELSVELGLFWFGGRRALDKVRARAHDHFGPRARLTTLDKAWVVARALAHRRGGSGGS